MSQQASFGQLALTYCCKFLPLEVLQSAAGHYKPSSRPGSAVSRLLVPSGSATAPVKA